MSAPAQAVAPTPIGVDCVSLDRGRIIYHGGAVLFGAAGLSGTLAAIPTNDDTKLRNGLLIGSAVSAAIGVGSEAIAQGLGNEWVKYCSGP